LQLVSSSFTELTYQVSGDTLTLNWAGTYAQGLPYTGDYNAVFTFAGVPEPSTWAMMILGAAGVGAIARRRRAGRVLAAG
jgi:hypothetical protein